MRTRSHLVAALAAVTVAAIAACSSGPDSNSAKTSPPVATKKLEPIAPPAATDPKAHDYPGIHNAVAYHEGFISGSVPEGEEGFETLQAMGVKTIISVDGAMPEVDKAAAHGMKYIHLPIGYNGFDNQRKLELVRATRDAMEDGPVYIHCHHGKHRSAGAAAAVTTSLGWTSPDEGVARMKVSGTAPNYTGLYGCAQSSTVIPTAQIDSISGKFPSISRPSGFVQGMIEIDAAFDHLKAIEKAGWKVPADHPDLVPVAEAGRLADLCRVLAEGDRCKKESADFTHGIVENGERATALEDMLAAGETDAAKLSAQFKLVGASCKDCHAKYRDKP